MTHLFSNQFSPFRLGRVAHFAAAKKGPEAAGPAFEAPKTKPETKELKDLVNDANLTLDKVKQARSKFDAAMKQARDAAKDSYDKSPKAKKDNDAYDAFRRDMDDLDRDANNARENARDKIAEIQDRKIKEQEKKLTVVKEQGDWERKFKREPGLTLDAERRIQMEQLMATSQPRADAANEAFRHPDGWEHDFGGGWYAGADRQQNATLEDKMTNYRNSDRSFAEGYYRAMIVAGKEGEAKDAMKLAYEHGTFDSRIDRAKLEAAAKVGETQITEVDGWSKGGRPGDTFLSKNEPAYIATFLRLAGEKWASDPTKLATYRDFIKKRLEQIGPALDANGKDVRDIMKNYSESTWRWVSDADKKKYNDAVDRERNLVMAAIPTPEDFEAGKALNLDSPGLSEVDMQKETARRQAYVDKVNKYVANFDALFVSDGGHDGKWPKASWEKDATAVMEKNLDGSYVYTTRYSPEEIQRFVSHMQEASDKKMGAMRTALAKIKELAPKKAAVVDGHLANLNGKDVFTVDPAQLKAAADFERMYTTVLTDPDVSGAGGGTPTPGPTPGPDGGGTPTPGPTPGPDGGGTGGSGDKSGGDAADGDSAGGGSGGGRRKRGGGGTGGREKKEGEGADAEKDPAKRRQNAIEDLRKNFQQNEFRLPVDNDYLSIDAKGKITYKQKLRDALNGGTPPDLTIPLDAVFKPKGTLMIVRGDDKIAAVAKGDKYAVRGGDTPATVKEGDLLVPEKSLVEDALKSNKDKVLVALRASPGGGYHNADLHVSAHVDAPEYIAVNVGPSEVYWFKVDGENFKSVEKKEVDKKVLEVKEAKMKAEAEKYVAEKIMPRATKYLHMLQKYAAGPESLGPDGARKNAPFDGAALMGVDGPVVGARLDAGFLKGLQVKSLEGGKWQYTGAGLAAAGIMQEKSDVVIGDSIAKFVKDKAVAYFFAQRKAGKALEAEGK